MSRICLALAVLAAATLAGCDREDLFFRPVTHDVGLGPGLLEHARYAIATQPDGTAAFADVAVRGFAGPRKGPDALPADLPSNDRIVVDISVRNRTAAAVTLPLSRFYLIDDDGVRMDQPRIFSREATGDSLAVPPATKARAELSFALPDAPGRLRTLGSVRLFWSAESAGGPPPSHSFVTKFIRSAQPQVYYYEPEPYYPYPYYYGSPYPYSYPYRGRVIIHRHSR